MKTHNIIFILLTIILIFIRCVIDSHPNLLFIVALLNLFSLAVVFISITAQLSEKVIAKSKGSEAPKQLVKRETKLILKIVYIIPVVVFLIFSSLYLLFGISNLGNDIIAIFSLGVSLIDSWISDIIVKYVKF